MKRKPRIVWSLTGVCLIAGAGAGEAHGAELAWAGKGAARLIVDVPVQPNEREGDERPAEVRIDFARRARELGVDRRPDLSTLQVIRHDARSGAAVESVTSAFGRSRFDVPWRWYDDAIGYEFPEVARAVSITDETPRYTDKTRLGYFYDCLGDWKSGRLVFAHRVDRKAPARYALYFDWLPRDANPERAPVRGTVGDGLHRCALEGASTTGLIHSRVEIVDWDEDGLFDLLVGCARGGVVWYPNRGRPGEPRFPFSKLVRTRDGKPLDVGWSAAPHVVDWDEDGLFDLLVGAEWTRLLWYRNRGEPGHPEFEYAGPVRTDDGQILTLPHEPVPESPGTYRRDYYPVVTTTDWDDDGDRDLLAGGYVTGRVYLFENVAGPGVTPKLRGGGALQADGAVIDVGWCAAPTVADLDNDGDLDLISGSMPMSKGGGDGASSDRFLYYFRNDGTRAEPELRRQEFPREGAFPHSSLGTPRLVDWSGDGLLDLVVSAHTNIYLFRNLGTAERPRIEAHDRPLPSRWSSAPLAAPQLLDWNGDGLLDGVDGPKVSLNQGRGNPGIYDKPISLLKPGQKIDHLSGIGDDWRYQRLYDLDADGRLDLMDADHGGHVWWHPNRGTREQPDFATTGHRLELTDGEPVLVGLNRTGFNKLQGARTTYTVGDFDGDGRSDLVVADNFGIVRYFRQATEKSEPVPRFEAPVELGKLRSRCVPCTADWNGDGHQDVVIGSSADDVVVFLNRGEPDASTPFLPARKLDLPSAPYGAGAPLVVADYNGDGDVDLIVNTAYRYTCLFERSFIESGYALAKITGNTEIKEVSCSSKPPQNRRRRRHGHPQWRRGWVGPGTGDTSEHDRPSPAAPVTTREFQTTTLSTSRIPDPAVLAAILIDSLEFGWRVLPLAVHVRLPIGFQIACSTRQKCMTSFAFTCLCITEIHRVANSSLPTCNTSM